MEEINSVPRDPSRQLADSLLDTDPTHATKSSMNSIKKTQNFVLHLRLLLMKNITVQRRSLKTLGIQLLMPVVICLLILVLQFFANLVVNQSVQNPPITSIGKIPQCFVNAQDPDNCTTIAYAVVGTPEPWMHSVMQYVAQDNNLTDQKDLKFLGEIQPSYFTQYLTENINQTQLGVIFCNSEWPISEGLTIPCKFARNTSKKLLFYSIVYNATEIFSSFYTLNTQGAQPTDSTAASLKISLDNAIFSYFKQDELGKGDQDLVLDPEDPTMPKIRNINKQEFPRSFLRFMIGVDIVTSTGALQFFVPYMVNFIFIVLEIVREKEKRLRQGLSVMGMSHGAYWISWVLTSTLINFCITMILMGMGYCFKYPFFTDTPFIIVFTLFFLFGQALQSLAFWITTICNDSKTAYTVAFSSLLISVVLQAFLTTAYVSFMFFIDQPPIWFVPIRFLFELIPSFNFAIIFGQITLHSGRHYDLNNNLWAPGYGFTYEHLFEPTIGNINRTWYHVPAPIIFYGALVLNTALYLMLTWYCDNVIAHNRGMGKSLVFCFRRAGKRRSSTVDSDGQNIPPHFSFLAAGKNLSGSTNESDDGSVAESVRREKEKVMLRQTENTHNDGLRILNLTKKYKKSSGKQSESVKALKNVFMGIDTGELLSLLGPNGAGKTTLIGVLTGLLSPSEGTAMINGLDLRYQIDDIREVIGVCPQFDILWDELTAEEHLYMFAKLKRIPDKLISREIDERLQEVNLHDMRFVKTKAFSGGMKRRLSIAIALIGNPKIVFLDEPTTGMDPKNRQYIWQLIQRMKKGRAVMLTTHAMEEADALSDRIAIIMKGQLRCIGTPISLKNTYGDGYRLSFIIDKNDAEGTIEYIKSKLPSGRIVDNSGGSVIVGIPLSEKKEMQAFIKIIEEEEDTPEKREFQKRIKDWGLRHSTLEEVFMKVSKESKTN